jgi:pimeloyl-ACP methyl ester carboxylesterase
MDDGFVRVSGNRQLAYRATGPVRGFPILFFHGLAESRLTTHPDGSILSELGIRLIAIDRPGVGLSDAHPRRRLLDWPTDIAMLADHLGCPKFAIIGHSAGAPYVAACAYAMPERILSASIVSGICPFSFRLLRPMLTSKFCKIGVPLFCVPAITRPAIWAGIKYARPRVRRIYERHLAHLGEADRDAMADPALKDMRILSLLEAVRQGPEGLCEDIVLLRRSWGFAIEEIKFPIRVWHGDLDKIVDISFGRELLRLIPDSRAEFRSGIGHNVLFSHWRQIISITWADGFSNMERPLEPANDRHILLP